MRYLLTIVAVACCSCFHIPVHKDGRVVAQGHAFINAFYSFDHAALQQLLTHAASSQPNILYYQQWAKCGNYSIVKQGSHLWKNAHTIVIPVTVKDDLMKALRIDFNVTDSFTIVVKDGIIRSVDNSSNDLPVYYQAKEWTRKYHPEWVVKACEGEWKGGPTPCDCILGMIRGFDAFVQRDSIVQP